MVLPSAIVVVTLGIVGFSARDLMLPVTDVKVAPVIAKFDPVRNAGARVVVQAPGWVEADPFPVAVSALTDGVVKEVLVLEGDRVAAGQVVARLVDDDAKIALSQADAHLAEEQARLTSALARQKEAEANWKNPIELQRACNSQTAQLSEKRAELVRWPAEVAREKAAAVALKADYDRIAPLYEAGRASEIEYIRARQAFEVQQAEVEKAQLRKPIIEAQIAVIEAELTAALKQLELRIVDTRAVADAAAEADRARAVVGRARAMRDAAALTLERMNVRAPVDGVVMERLVEPGSKLMRNMDNAQSAQAVRLYDPGKLQVRVDVPLADAAKVGVGQSAEIVVDVLPDRVFAGRVSRVAHQADVQKNTLQVKVAIEAPIAAIKPEMLARARFLGLPTGSQGSAGAAQALYGPARAMHNDSDGQFVWLADGTAGVARRGSVETGRQTKGGYVEIRKGVRLGDRLIVDAPANLKDGDRIRIVGEAEGVAHGAD